MPSRNMTHIRLLAVFFILAFAGLLAVRMDLLGGLFSGGNSAPAAPSAAPSDTDTWKSLFLNDKKIGYAHSILKSQENGYRLDETLFMRMNIMGFLQDLRMHTSAALNPDLTLSAFTFRLDSGLFRFTASGRMKPKNILHIETSLPGPLRKKEIALKHPPYLTAGMLYAAARKLKAGQTGTFSFPIFDPATMSREPVTVRATGRETVRLQGKNIKTTRLEIRYKGVAQTAWMDETGEIVKEKGILGMTLEKTTETAARAGISSSGGRDLTRLASVPADKTIAAPRRAARLRIRLGGISYNNLDLDGGRQRLSGDILTITRETINPPPASIRTIPAELKRFLATEPFIESDDPRIKKLANRLVSPDDTPLQKAEKLVDWVFKNIRKQPVLSLPDAVTTLKNRVGDCNEHSVLLAALARAAGIPAKLEAGLVYMNGRFYYHAWNRLYAGDWITADAVFGQVPADATHIRFVSGGPGAQLDLVSVIDRVKISILENDTSG